MPDAGEPLRQQADVLLTARVDNLKTNGGSGGFGIK
jgi:hypothetical protein